MCENFNVVDPRFSRTLVAHDHSKQSSDPNFWLDGENEQVRLDPKDNGHGQTQILDAQTSLLNGSYDGQDAHARFVLRIDDDTVSGDIFRLSPMGDFGEWTASFRSSSPFKSKPNKAKKFALIFEDKFGATAQGSLQLTSLSTCLAMELLIEKQLVGLPVNTSMRADLHWEGPNLRHLTVNEIRETGAATLQPVEHMGLVRTLESSLLEAGFAVQMRRLTPDLPTPTAGSWSEKALIELMMTNKGLDTTGSEFATQLCMLSRSNRAGLAGIMFDGWDTNQRQWLAVFSDTIKQFSYPSEFDRDLLQTTLHELRHALNLVHRFERNVGRADSTPIINYPQKHRGGGRDAAFWNTYDFSFDPDEVPFLKNATHTATRPGGKHFHSVRYWETGKGSHSPYMPEYNDQPAELELILPQGGPVFLFAQPVILGLRFKNKGSVPLDVPQTLLDQKSGHLEFLIERESSARHDHMEDNVFIPVVHRLNVMSQANQLHIQPNQVIEGNANLTFGNSGFPFAEPGNYRVTAYLLLSQPGQSYDRIVKSAPLRLRISMPQTRPEEQVALEMLSDEAGLFFALGGLPALSATQDRLLAMTKDQLKARHNPLAANIRRAAGFGAGREYVHFEHGKVKVSAADTARKRRHLKQVVKDGLSAFDKVTSGQMAAHLKAMG